jgi:O-methyltransferase
VKPFTLVSEPRIRSLYELSLKVETEHIPGDFVECGVCDGGTAAILGHFAASSASERTVWLFDSFEGMPEPSAEDTDAAKGWAGKDAGRIERVLQVLKSVGSDIDQVRIVKGWFEETFGRVSIPRIALLNIDADWYESVRLCLSTFYEAVVPGGFISIDDYGHWPGCRQAVDEFLTAQGLNASQLQVVDYTARWLRKPKGPAKTRSAPS